MNSYLSCLPQIILVDDDDDDAVSPTDAGYFDGSLDDLGAAYRRSDVQRHYYQRLERFCGALETLMLG